MITKEGVVTATLGKDVLVKTIRSKSCDACSAKDSCGEASGFQEMTVKIENSLNASAGDHVVVGFRTAPLLKITFMLYILPVILLITGAAAGDKLAAIINTDPSVTALIAGGISLVIAFVIIRLINNSLKDKKEFQPFLKRFSRKNETCTPS
ncbi:MAG: SoxR reducing system RseC family protein [Desulfamplus sp.]|nr:SoxR reducing system RseC family protein [Desulfamplus sp.]